MAPAHGGQRTPSPRRVSFGRAVGLVLGAAILAASLSAPAQALRTLPDHLWLVVGEHAALHLDLPWPLQVHVDRRAGLRVDGGVLRGAWAAVPGGSVSLQPVEAGMYHVELRFLGVVPLRHLTVQALPRVDVVPGGQSVGVVLSGGGAVVTRGTHTADRGGLAVAPAHTADLRVAGRRVEGGEGPVRAPAGISAAVEPSGGAGPSVRFAAAGGAGAQGRSLGPASDPAAGRVPAGASGVDGAATGLGTLTFYDPVSEIFGALGHVVANDRGTAFRFGSGSLVPAVVAGLERGQRGAPGEKLGVFLPDGTPLGSILLNTPLGVFGHLDRVPGGGLVTRAIPIASEEQVHPGPAQMLTVIAGRSIQSFRIDIVRVVPQNRPEAKGLLLHVTDPRLLASTGGIVQGMSGSPILQGGRLVGAVTHVFVNDPTSGYGVLAVWMAEEAHLLRAPSPAPALRLALP